MDYLIKDAPFRKRVSKVINRSFRDIIYQKSKSPQPIPSFSPPRVSFRAPQVPQQSSLLDKIIRSEHKINSNKIQILKLPKLPFGKHQNYNNEELFVSNHFIEMENTEKSRELDDAMKKFRLYEKRFKKSSVSLIDADSIMEKKKDYFVYKTNAGNLIAKKNKKIIQQYEDIRKDYRHFKGASFELLPDFDAENANEKICDTKRTGKSLVSNMIKRLYPSPKPYTNRVLENLVPKFSALFDIEDSVSGKSLG